MQIASPAPLVRVHVFYDADVREFWANSPDLDGVPRHCPSRHTANEILKQMGVDQRF